MILREKPAYTPVLLFCVKYPDISKTPDDIVLLDPNFYTRVKTQTIQNMSVSYQFLVMKAIFTVAQATILRLSWLFFAVGQKYDFL